jgi:hypothetical protein
MYGDIRVCFEGCCHWIRSQQVVQADFDQAVHAADPIHHNPVLTKVRCPKSLSPASDDIEKGVGFYLGVRCRLTDATLLTGATLRFLKKERTIRAATPRISTCSSGNKRTRTSRKSKA